MLGLERGTVKLLPHQIIWDKHAKDTIMLLKGILGDFALDIQHIGSTSILGIHAKPIIDIVVGIGSLEDIKLYIEKLKQHGIVFRGQDVEEQFLFVIGNFKNNTRTHHIHVVKWNGIAWNNYINFRDYLNNCKEKAILYDTCKQKLASQCSDNRKSYTEGKQELISFLLNEAHSYII